MASARHAARGTRLRRRRRLSNQLTWIELDAQPFGILTGGPYGLRDPQRVRKPSARTARHPHKGAHGRCAVADAAAVIATPPLTSPLAMPCLVRFPLIRFSLVTPPMVTFPLVTLGPAPGGNRPKDLRAIRQLGVTQKLPHRGGAPGNRRHPDRRRKTEFGSLGKLAPSVSDGIPADQRLHGRKRGIGEHNNNAALLA